MSERQEEHDVVHLVRWLRAHAEVCDLRQGEDEFAVTEAACYRDCARLLESTTDALVAARAEREGLHTTIRTLMADLRTADAALAAAQQDAARWQAYKATAEMVSVGPGSGYYLTGKPVDGIVLPTADAYADALLAGEQPGKQPETDAEVPHVD